MLFLDSETCGFHGLPIILQYVEDDKDDIKIWNFWKNPISESLELLEWVAQQDIVGFNLAYDWFHIYKIWTTFNVAMEKLDGQDYPEDHIDFIAECEEKARDFPLCLKPNSACDLMLHAQSGKYQSLMRRKPIKIKRVPTQLANFVKQELEARLKFDDILFAKQAKKTTDHWVIKDIKSPDGGINPAFKNIELTFKPSTALKVLAEYALEPDNDYILKFADVDVPKKMLPKELGYAPFAMAIGEPGYWRGAWPDVISYHINHWEYNSLARKYAEKDVVYTRKLYYHLESPEPGDTDSELACMVACVRWRGFEIDIENLIKLRDETQKKIDAAPIAPNNVKAYLSEVMNNLEKLALNEGTGEEILNSISEWEGNIEAASRAQAVINARHAAKEKELYDKLIKARKFHASFKVIGALSTRMSGADDLNSQGIKSTETVRSNFTLKRDGYILCGGDFDSFEVGIAESVYNDENLRQDILSGKSPHGLFACELYPPMTYEEVKASKNTEDDKYADGKTAFFRLMYGGNWEGMVDTLKLNPEVAEKAFNNFLNKYPGIKRHRDHINDDFCSMKQPGGIGKEVIWHDPKDYIDNGLGFKRYFTLENRICKVLFDLSNGPPGHWKYIKGRVTRRDRVQTIIGATQSALYAAAFNLQARNLRAAANHEIQSKGATITKELERKIWDVQPSGVHTWLVQPLNIHDEIMCPSHPSILDKVKNVVDDVINFYKPIVPLLSMTWKQDLKSWADK